jgi:hypothetical protein
VNNAVLDLLRNTNKVSVVSTARRAFDLHGIMEIYHRCGR